LEKVAKGSTMVAIRECVEEACIGDLNEMKNYTLKDVAKELYNRCHRETYYILYKGKPVHYFYVKELLKLLTEGKGELSLVAYLRNNRTPPILLSGATNIFDAYNYLRKYRANYALVVESGKVIGEVQFRTLTWQIIDTLIKDPLTGLYNYHYFNILIERYKDIEKPMGIILVEIENLEIIERFQSATLVNKILKQVADTILHSVRNIDFVFRIDNRFTVMLFQPLEVIKKVEERIQNRLNDLEVDGVSIRFKIAYSHVPELKETILMAIDDCERKILKQSEYNLL